MSNTTFIRYTRNTQGTLEYTRFNYMSVCFHFNVVPIWCVLLGSIFGELVIFTLE